MENTMLIELTNHKAIRLLRELEQLHLIKVIEDNTTPTTKKLSEKYRGMLSKEDGKLLNEHIEKMRSEWSSI